MPVRATSFFIASAVAAAVAGPVQAQGLRQVATIPIPGTPINQFGVMTIDQESGFGYLADKDNKSVVVFDTKTTGSYVTRITSFVGMTGSGKTSGPNGLAVVKSGAELWVSDGDSTIKVVDLKSGKIASTIATGGKARANAMAFDADGRVVLVANSDDSPPFLSLISTDPGRKIVATIPVPESGENLERSAFHAATGTFFTVVPVLRTNPLKGLLLQTDPKSGKLVQRYEIDRCHPHSLSIVTDQTILMGCSTAHGPSPQPGGDMAIFDIAVGKVEGYGAGLGGNGGSAFNPKLGLYYHATTNAALVVADVRTPLLGRKIPTWNGARSLAVNLVNNRVYLATTAKDGPCGGCIVVFAPQ